MIGADEPVNFITRTFNKNMTSLATLILVYLYYYLQQNNFSMVRSFDDLKTLANN